MRIKRFLTPILIWSCMVLLAGCNTTVQPLSNVTDHQQTPPPAATSESSDATPPHAVDLSQESQLEEVEKQEKASDRVESRLRRRYEIVSGTPAPQRITLDQVMEIIQKNSSYEMIVRQIEAIHGLPDADVGSGIQRLEFWLDDAGTEKIEAALYRINYFNAAHPEQNKLLFVDS